jgi:hypothetical protein
MDRAIERPAIRTDHRDSGVLTEIATWYLSAGMPAALGWLWEQGPGMTDLATQHPPGSHGDATATKICAYFDTLGVFCRQGLVSESLLVDWLNVAPVWDRLKSYVQTQRDRTGDPSLWNGFEALALAQKRQIGHYAT